MPAQWTGEIIGEMHIFRISHQALAEAIGWHPKYLSHILNSPNPPQAAEQKCRTALASIIESRAKQS